MNTYPFNFSSSTMGQPPPHVLRGNPVKSSFHLPVQSNASYTTIDERHGPLTQITSPISSTPTSQYVLSISPQRYGDENVNPDSHNPLASPSSTQSQTSETGDEPPQLGPRGGRRGKKVHYCKFPKCGRIYTRHEHLARHEKSHIVDDNEHYCKICKQKLSRGDTFQKHLLTKKHQANSVTYQGASSTMVSQGADKSLSTTPSFQFPSNLTSPTVLINTVTQPTTLRLHQLSPNSAIGQQQVHTSFASASTPSKHNGIPYCYPPDSVSTAQDSSTYYSPLQEFRRIHSPPDIPHGRLNASAYTSLPESLAASMPPVVYLPVAGVKGYPAMSRQSPAQRPAFDIGARLSHKPTEAKKCPSKRPEGQISRPRPQKD